MRDRMAAVIFCVGGVLSVAWGYRDVRSVLTSLDTGIGAFGSSSDYELLGYLLPVLVAFWLSARLRKRGRPERMLRRAHLWATATLVVIFLLFVGQVLFHFEVFGHGETGWAFLVATFVAGALWLPVQGFFASGFLALLIMGARQSSEM